MAIDVSPLLFASGTRPPSASAAPVMAATATKPGKAAAGFLLFAAAAEEVIPITANLKADTLREAVAAFHVSFGTLREVKGEEHPVSLRFGTSRELLHDASLHFDAARTVNNRLRYANRGIPDALFSGGGTVVADPAKTDTGTGVTEKNGAYLTPLEAAIGFSGLDEVWARWDAWLPAENGQNAVTWLFFAVSGYSPMPSGISGGQVLFSGAPVGDVPALGGGIHKFVMRIGRSGIELFIDDDLAVSSAGSLPEGTVWTHTAIHTGEQVLSNIIVANYDVSSESLVPMQKHVLFSFCTVREAVRVVEKRCAASRSLPHMMGNGAGTGIQSVTMTLAESTLSDSFQMVAARKIQPKEAVRGTLLDFPYRFQAEATHEEGILCTVKKTMYDADRMLYTPIKYAAGQMRTTDYWGRDGRLGYAAPASEHAKAAARAMGLSPVLMFNDFIPQNDYAGTETTYQSILSGVFGWTKNVPRMQINIFVRGGRLYFLQRGHETGTVSLDGRPFSHPSVDKAVMRTAWSQGADTRDIPEAVQGIGDRRAVKPVYFIDSPGNFSESPDNFFDEWNEEAADGGGGNGGERPTRSVKENPDGTTTVTEYKYIATKHDYLLKSIKEVTSFPSGEVYKTRETEYRYTASGYRVVYVYENNELVSKEESEGGDYFPESQPASSSAASTAYRGRPGDSGNEHYDEQVSLAHGGSWSSWGTSKGNSFLDASKGDAPVLDYDTIKRYLDELEWMDRRIEETAKVIITAPVRQGIVDAENNHVMDFFDTYVLNGKRYWLVSNTVSLTPRKLSQTLTLARWY